MNIKGGVSGIFPKKQQTDLNKINLAQSSLLGLHTCVVVTVHAELCPLPEFTCSDSELTQGETGHGEGVFPLANDDSAQVRLGAQRLDATQTQEYYGCGRGSKEKEIQC